MGTIVIENEIVQRVLNKAKGSPKGRYYIYESYKREFEGLNLSPEDYRNACIVLAKILRV